MIPASISPALYRQAFLVGAVFAVYGGTFGYPFQFDGIKEILHNQVIKDISRIDLIWNYNPSRFLLFFSFAVNHALGGVDTFGYHLYNILLHVGATLLVYHFIGLLFRAAARLEGEGQNRQMAGALQFFMALIYAVHPLNTQAITYIWQRSASMVAVFYLFSMVAYLKSSLDQMDGAPQERWKPWRALALATALAAMLTKQSAFTLPMALVLMEYLVISGSVARLRQRAIWLAPFLPLLLIVPLLTVFYQAGEVTHLAIRAVDVPPPLHYLFTQFDIIILYLKLMVFPVGQNLDHHFILVTSFWDSADSFALLMAILAAGVWLGRKNPMASFGVLFFFLTMSVESSFFPLPDWVFEHRMYLPSVGLYIALAALAETTTRNRGRNVRWSLLAVAVAAVALLGVATVKRNQVWATSASLWEDVVKKSPDQARGYINLGSVKKRAGEYSRAQELYEKAVELGGGAAEVHHDLGVLKRISGDLAGAETSLRMARKLKPDMIITALELGKVLEAQGKYMEAGAEYTAAANLSPTFIAAHSHLAALLEKMGKPDLAEKVYMNILKQNPGDGGALEAMARLLRARGENDAAEEYAARATQTE
ncbi:MAG: tetratricopeptide repeat protein [Nitrospinota bacterium]|nr:tetratricopeptide repeat protein [Nitrospinota bacterium]